MRSTRRAVPAIDSWPLYPSPDPFTQPEVEVLTDQFEGACKFDSQGRLHVGVDDRVVRFDPASGEVTTVAGLPNDGVDNIVFDSEDRLRKEWLDQEPYILGDVWKTVEIKRAQVPPLFEKWKVWII